MSENRIRKTDSVQIHGPASAGIWVTTAGLLKFNPAGTAKEVVELTEVQTLTNKTLTAPALASPTITGTPLITGVASFVGGTAGAATAALVLGGGTAATPCATATANKNFIGFWTKSTATTGDSRGIYLRHYFAGAGGSGDAARIFGTVDNVAAATGGTVTGAHISLSLSGASGSVSGQSAAARVTFGADAQTRTLNGNSTALIVESDIATGNTVPATMALIRVVNLGAAPVLKLFRLPTVASAGLLAAHTTDAITHSIRCVDDAGTVFYIMATTTASNRTGGA